MNPSKWFERVCVGPALAEPHVASSRSNAHQTRISRRAMSMLASGIVAATCLVVAPPRQASADTLGSVLNKGQFLTPGDALQSNNGLFTLNMQHDGNLVLYGLDGAWGWKAIWSSQTWGQSVRDAIMQADGNFVIYATSGAAVWNSRTWGHSGAFLSLQDDANLVVYASNRTPLWATYTKYVHEQQCAAQVLGVGGCGLWSIDLYGYFAYNGQSAWWVVPTQCQRTYRSPAISDFNITWCSNANQGAQSGPMQFGVNWTYVQLVPFPPSVHTALNWWRIDCYPDGHTTDWWIYL
jgi:hypothetical protein